MYNPTVRPTSDSCDEEKRNDVSSGGGTGGAGCGPERSVRSDGQQREEGNNTFYDHSVCSPTTGSSLGGVMEGGRLRHGNIGRKILPIEGIA